MTEMEFIREIGYYLKNALREDRTNQKQLSEFGRISEAAISYCLSGNRMPNIITIINIADGLERPIEDFIDPYEIVRS